MIHSQQEKQTDYQLQQNGQNQPNLQSNIQIKDNTFIQSSHHKKQQLLETNQNFPVDHIQQLKQLYEIEEGKQYFSIKSDDHSHSCVRGKCQAMISQKQLQQKGYDEFEKYPFQPIAKYIRNKSYDDSEQVRTPQALDSSLNYLKTNILVSILNDQKKIKKVVFGNTKNQNIEDEKQTELKQKRLSKILNIIQKQSHLQLIQQQTLNSLVSTGNVVFNQKLQKKLERKGSQKNIKSLFLPDKILVFLQSRLAAIRCELFAQGVVFPRLTMNLLKCQIFLYTLRQNQYCNIIDDLNSHQELKLAGLNVILDQNFKHTLLSKQDFSYHYKEALIIAILTTSKKDLMRLIDQHELVLENKELLQLFKLRLDIERGNYQKYFYTLSKSTSILVQCLLLTHLRQMRIKLCEVLKSAKIDVKKGWLGVLMGFKIKTEQANEIINLSKNKEYISEKYEKREIEPRQKQLKNWIKIEDLFYELIMNPNQVQENVSDNKKVSIKRDNQSIERYMESLEIQDQ